MGYYAKVLNKKVINVISAEEDYFNNFIDTSPGEWIKTSYNTRGNVHYAPNSNNPDGGIALRGNYAGIDFTYDTENDVFYAPQPYASWTLNQSTWLWEPPTPRPTNGIYSWNETTKSWMLEE